LGGSPRVLGLAFGLALPDQLFTLIAEHRKLQDREREHAGTEWHEGGWMFAQPTGKPLDPRRDQYQWKALLDESWSSRSTAARRPPPPCCFSVFRNEP
jgi:hypothetical protein